MDESILFEIFKGLGRKGPGSEACTGNAFAMLPSLPEHAEILDVGCGAGAQALELARLCPGCHITALDHPPTVP